MGFTRHLLAAVRVAHALGHVLRGLWTIHRTFHRLTPSERQRQVQAWSLQMLQIMGVSLRAGGAPPAVGPLLVVANHISWLDILVLNAVRPARFVSKACLLYTSPSPRDYAASRMPSSA